MTTAAPDRPTRSTYSSNGLTVSIDWNDDPTPTKCWLIAHVIMPDGTRTDRIAGRELDHVLKAAAKKAAETGAMDYTHYARIYWGMIL